MRHGEHTYRTLLRKLWRPAGKCSGTRKGCQVERELICTYNHQINRRQATSSWVLSIAQTCVPSARKRYASRSTCALAATAACVPARSPCPPWSTLPISTAPLFPMISPHMWHASQMNASCVAPVCLSALLITIATSKIFSLMPGAVVMREGEFGRSIYFVLEGRFELSATGPDGKELPVAILRRGEYFGEHGMLSGQQRNVTARAQTAAVLLEVPEQVMQRLVEIVPAVGNFFEQLDNARSIEAILKRMALFQGVSAVDIRQIAEQTQVKRYDRDEILFSEGAPQNVGAGFAPALAQAPVRESMHVLLEGFVKVARRTSAGTGRDKTDERIIAYRQGGDYFAGGLDLLGDGRPVTVTAITRTSVAEVSRQALLTLFSRYPEVNQRFTMRLQQYRDAAAAAQTGFFDPLAHTRTETVDPLSDAEARAGLRELVGGGVVEGTEVLVIDLDLCIHCNECEEACARRHGHSRMNRKGMVVGNISIATACRQCQDPVCMLCSRAGIARLPSGEVYITDSCIGCGICAERCPYDNISIMTLEEESESPSSWQQFSNFFTKGAGKERGRKSLPMLQAAPGPLDVHQPRDAYGELRKKLAIKCDLCAGYNNQACVQACPTGAAMRVQPSTFFGSTEDILSKRAR